LKFGSVCSGIEAASVAFEPLGFTAQWFSEIEHFPSEVLKYRYPTVPNLGDMTKLTENETFRASSIDLLVGGTPCQSFSVAGLRGGLADPRGNLMLTFLSLADAKKPRWIVWENVPGVLSSNGGKDFGTFLGALGELGYGFAYRVLDAQHFGVAQRRRRVFVVGYLGDWRPAAAVLFERESLSRDIKPSRKKRQEVTTDAKGGVGEASDVSCAGGNVSPCVTSKWKTGYGGPSGSNETGNMVYEQVAHPVHAFKVRGGCEGGGKGYLGEDEKAFTISTTQDKQIAQPIPILAGEHPQKGVSIDVCPTLPAAMGMGGGHTPLVPHPVAYSFDSLASNSMKSSNPNSGCREVQTSKTIDTTTPEPSKNQGGIAIAQPFRKVRRAQSETDFETWEKDEKANTLNCFDQGDVRSTNVVAQPITMEKIAGPIDASYYKGQGSRQGGEREFVAQPIQICFNDANGKRADRPNGGCYITENPKASPTVTCAESDLKVLQPIAVDWRTAQVDQGITQTLKTDLAKMSGPCVAVDTYNYTTNNHTTQTIRTNTSTEHIGAVLQTKSAGFLPTQGSAAKGIGYSEEMAPTLRAGCDSYGVHTPQMAIRRLTPKECERLQGFPDDWTQIPYRNKPADQCPDGPRYKACGNSMAVPVMRWIGQRIQLIDTIIN
jgi:site-specific DNA-cytosine methylase